MISNYLVEHKHLGIKRTKHGLFMYNRNDLFIGKSLDLYGEWCEYEILLLRNFIRESDVVVDVGANIGTHSVAFAGMVGNSGKVHAFEPQPSLFYMLCGNVALNCLGNVNAYRKAIGAVRGEIGLPDLPSADTPFNFGAVPMAGSESQETVETVAVDDLGLSDCRLIKIDIEGMELDALRGSRETVQKCKPFLFIENNTIDRSSRVIEAVFQLGYKAYWHIRPYFHQDNFFCNSENVFSGIQPEANLFCFPKGLTPETFDLIECTSAEDNWLKVVERYRKA